MLAESERDPMSRLRACVVLVVAVVVWHPGPGPSAQGAPEGTLRIVVLVDSSSATSAMFTQFRAGLSAFLDALPPVPAEPEVAIISTGRQLRIRVPPTRDREALDAAAASFSSDGGGNAFLDSLLEADRRYLQDVPVGRAVFVILTTDTGAALGGEPRVDAYNRFAKDFQARGGRAHAIVVRSANTGVTIQIAENLAANTGGSFEAVSIGSAVPELMKAVADRIASGR